LYQFSVPASALITFSLIQIIFMIILIRNAPERGARELGYVILSMTFYTIGTSFEYMSLDLSQIMFWVHIQYIGLSWISFFMIHFVIKYFDIRVPFKKVVYSFLALLSTLFMVMQFTYNFHPLFYTDVAFRQIGNIAYLSFTPKVFYFLIKILQVIALGLFYFFSVQMLVNHKQAYKRRAIILIIATIIPSVANIIYVLPLYTARIDFIPFSFIVSSLILLSSYYNDSLFGPLPVAKRLVFESLSDGIIILDKNDSLIDYNSKCSEYIPSLVNFKIGAPIQDYFAQIPCYDELSRAELYGSGEWEVMIEQCGAGDEKTYFEVRVLPIQTGTTKGTSILIRDVSERCVLQGALRDSFDRLVELDNLKTMVIEVMSHDLRSPLMTMKSLRRLMASGIIAKNPVIWKKSGDELDALIDRADSLIFNLLALTSSFDTPKEVSHQIVALESVLEDVEPAIMRYAKKKEVIYKKEVEDDVFILGVLEYLRAICRNIIENAIKYSHKGGVVLLDVKIETESVLISIYDEGDGFPPHVLSAFNEDKWGVTTMGTLGEKGPGIGLYATKRFIHAQKGSIHIKPNEPMGTVVEITIPRAIGPISRSIV